MILSPLRTSESLSRSAYRAAKCCAVQARSPHIRRSQITHGGGVSSQNWGARWETEQTSYPPCPIMIVDETAWQQVLIWAARMQKSIGPIHSLWHPGSLPRPTGGEPASH